MSVERNAFENSYITYVITRANEFTSLVKFSWSFALLAVGMCCVLLLSKCYQSWSCTILIVKPTVLLQLFTVTSFHKRPILLLHDTKSEWSLTFWSVQGFRVRHYWFLLFREMQILTDYEIIRSYISITWYPKNENAVSVHKLHYISCFSPLVNFLIFYCCIQLELFLNNWCLYNPQSHMFVFRECTYCRVIYIHPLYPYTP